jgi:glycosyltransferase involved in cell wall biosynthesis
MNMKSILNVTRDPESRHSRAGTTVRGNAVREEDCTLHGSGEKAARRILFLITTLGVTGGAEKQLLQLATELKTRRQEVCVVAMVLPGDNETARRADAEACIRELESNQIAVHSLGMRGGVPDVRAVLRLRSVIKEFQPDVVHSHMYHANLLARVTRLLCPMPRLICTAHSIKESSQNGGPTWHKEALYRMTDALADRTTTICNAGFDRYIRVGAVPRKKFLMIPNGIDTRRFAPSTRQRHSARQALGIGSEFVWLAVGRLVTQKDYPTLFRAVELLGAKRYTVLIVGDGPLQQQLQDECAGRKLNGRIRFCGVREDPIEFYNAADGFVMSSDCEGLPMALLEAASVGLPAVVTNVGGMPEIVMNGVSGYVVPPHSATELASAMQKVMKASPEIREQMGCAARQHCRTHFGMPAVVDQWLQLYADSRRTA